MNCRAVFNDLPTKLVVIVDRPHPPAELVTIAGHTLHMPEPGAALGPANDRP
jgi:hypothetical protein